MMNSRKPENVQSEIDELRTRLAEAEQTLAAIRSGEVDAIVVDGPNGPQAFTLQSPDQPYRVLIEQMNEGTASISDQGVILYCNQRLADMLGHTPESLTGSPVDAIVLGPHRERFQELLARGLKGEARDEIEFQRKDGTTISVQASLRGMQAEQLRSICLVASDLSELKQKERTIQIQASQYAALLSTTSDGYWRYDREGKLLDVNDTYCRMSGFSRDELLRLHIAGIDAVESAGDVLRHIQEVARSGFARFETKHRKKNGETFDVEISACYLRVTEEFLLFARDISYRKRAEEERERAAQQLRRLNEDLENRVAERTQELVTANKELEAFNYAIAHDLRGPLQHIDGFATLLDEEAGPALDDSAKQRLSRIRQIVRHMGRLLTDLLDLSKLGRTELQTETCGLRTLVAEVVRGLQPMTKDRDLEWRITDLPWVDCDASLMKQVLFNLVSNAVKFSRDRHPAIIEIGQTMQTGAPAIFVRDNGVGFDMKYADKLFGVFQRLHRQEDFEGTGVGLAIVQRIVNRHGGRVWAEAGLNKGATFYFTLPTLKPTAQQEEIMAHTAV